MATIGTVVELAARLWEARTEHRPAYQSDWLDVEQFAAFAATLPDVELARVANRLRAAIAAVPGRPPADRVPVPAVPLGEVWDAPVRTWRWGDVVTIVTAVSVTGRTYLHTSWNPHGYEVPVDRFGVQVVARADVAGQPPAYAAFWLADIGGAAWRCVTGDLDAAGMLAWDGLPLIPVHRPSPAGLGMGDWLARVVAAAGVTW